MKYDYQTIPVQLAKRNAVELGEGATPIVQCITLLQKVESSQQVTTTPQIIFSSKNDNLKVAANTKHHTKNIYMKVQLIKW